MKDRINLAEVRRFVMRTVVRRMHLLVLVLVSIVVRRFLVPHLLRLLPAAVSPMLAGLRCIVRVRDLCRVQIRSVRSVSDLRAKQVTAYILCTENCEFISFGSHQHAMFVSGQQLTAKAAAAFVLVRQ